MQAGLSRPTVEGPSERWLLLAFGASIVVHIMTKDAREYYDLEGLWSDARALNFPEQANALSAARLDQPRSGRYTSSRPDLPVVGHRPMAGHRSLEATIMVRIHVPQPNPRGRKLECFRRANC